MKYCLIALLAGSLAIAQSTTSTYIPDINGGSVQASTVLSNAERTEINRSINGRQVPLEQTEERVLSQDANGTVTEKITRKYDPTGQLMSTERVVTDAQKLAGGASKVQATTFRSDINGQMQQAQRTTTETRKEGAVTYADTVVERPTLDDSFQSVEKRSAVTEVADGTSHEQETVYRRSENGDYYEALRQVTDERKAAGQTTTQNAYYEPDATGALRLSRQSVSTATQHPDGSEDIETNLLLALRSRRGARQYYSSAARGAAGHSAGKGRGRRGGGNAQRAPALHGRSRAPGESPEDLRDGLHRQVHGGPEAVA